LADVVEECTFDVTISVPADASIGGHSGTFRAIVSSDDTIYTTASFTVNVVPTEEKEQEIRDEFASLVAQFDILIAEFNSVKDFGGLPDENLSAADALINQANITLQEIEELIEAEDFIGADEKITSLILSLDGIREELDILGASGGGILNSIWFWIMILVIIGGVAGFLLYLFMPMKKSQKLKLPSLRKPKTYGYFTRIKDIFKKESKGQKTYSALEVVDVDKTPKKQVEKTEKNIKEPEVAKVEETPGFTETKQKRYDYQYNLGKRFKRKKKK